VAGFPIDPSDEVRDDGKILGLPKRFRLNVLSSYARTGTSALISLVLTPFLIAGLGTEGFGIWTVVGSLVWYRDILEFGFAAATPKYVAEYSANGDHAKLRDSIATSFWLLAIPGFVALLLGLGFAAVFPDLFGVSDDLRTASQVLVVIVTVDLALAMPGDAFSGVLAGLQRYDLMNGTFVVVGIGQAIAIAIVLIAGGGLVALGISTVAISGVGQIWRFFLAKRLVPELSLSPRRIDRNFVKPFAGLSVWLGITQISMLILNRVDTMIVGAVVGVGAAGIYSVGQKLTTTIGQFSEPVAEVFYPHSSELAAQSDRPGLRQSLVTGTRIQFAVAAPLALVLAILAMPGIEAWVGSGFDDAATVVAYLAGTVAIWAITNTGIAMLMGTGHAKGPGLIRAGEALLNFALSVTLASIMGLEGVALATLIAAVVANLGFLLPYVSRNIGVRLPSLITPLLLAHLPAAGITTIAGLALAHEIPTSIPVVVLAALALLVLYLGVLWVTGLRDAERQALIAPVRRLRTRS
jgi:O-antigen/teichoic acid export membrane protein